MNVDLLETFNYLIGLTVIQITAPRTFGALFRRDEEQRLHVGTLKQAADGAHWFRTITGTDPGGQRVLVIWRNDPEAMARKGSSRTTQFSTTGGPGFEPTNLKYMRQFYEAFDIGHSARDASSGLSDQRLEIEVELSWTHYRLLTKVHRIEARRYYMAEAVAGRWSTRELERQIQSRHFERGLATPSSTTGADLQPAIDVSTAASVLRDPYVLEFLGLPDRLISSERELEQALIDQLQEFLLELGRGFSFVGRQQRITIDGNHFHVDLVFCNFVIKCFVLIDLKTGELDHGDIGQMDFHVRYWEAEVRGTDDNPTIGLILCAEKSEAMARYTLLSDHQSIFAAKYLPYLPTEDELQRELQRERHVFEMRQLDAGVEA